MKHRNLKKSTQRYLPISEIRDGVVALEGGAYRTIVMVNSINFNLKSADEQESLLQRYSQFLNGLNFPIEIVMQSRQLDLDAYLKELEGLAQVQTNELLRAQTTDYIAFVRDLIGVASIMSKTFYVVIPYDIPPISQGLFKRKNPLTTGGKFEEVKKTLLERTQSVSSGLASLGLDNIQLKTQEVIELFYSAYNIDTAKRQKLFSVSNIDAGFIQSLTDEKTSEDQNAV